MTEDKLKVKTETIYFQSEHLKHFRFVQMLCHQKNVGFDPS